MKFIIFDIDGTLADTKQVEDHCFMTAFEQTFGLDIRQQRWEDIHHVTDWGITEEIIERELKRKPRQEEYELMISNFVRLLEDERMNDKAQFSEVSGAKDFFYGLKERSSNQLGIATGSWEQSARIKLDAIGIDPAGVCFSNSDYHKSREAITKDVIQQLERQTARKADQVIYFGDGAWDYKTCRNLGIQFIGIDSLGDGKLSAMGAGTVFPHFLAIDQIIKAIEKAGS